MEVQINAQAIAQTGHFTIGTTRLMVTPPIDQDYWLLRVPVSDSQAIVGFPKFGTIGIGFQVEEDWNTNFPYTCEAEDIFEHISHNKGSNDISDALCLEAIRAIQDAVKAWKKE